MPHLHAHFALAALARLFISISVSYHFFFSPADLEMTSSALNHKKIGGGLGGGGGGGGGRGGSNVKALARKLDQKGLFAHQQL